MPRLTPAKLFIDGGDPAETAAGAQLLAEHGFDGLDGQTTNPSLVAKNPDIAARIARGERLTSDELISTYEQIIRDIEKSLPAGQASAPGDISIEVYADKETTTAAMVAQARQFAAWSSSAVIKLPITKAGLAAAAELKNEMKLNLTLCFSQAQAAAVYAATAGTSHTVYVSPFIGRLDDININGMDLIKNILQMYATGDGHVSVLTASVRGVEHILGALALGTGALTMPFDKAFKPWAQQNFVLPDANYHYASSLAPITYEALALAAPWESFNIQHDLTDKGLQKFADDWNSLLAP